jgi:hypothetical protein
LGPIHPDEDTNVAMNDEDRLYFPGSFASQDQYETVRPFSKNTFTDADVASRYITSDKFREFWSRGGVPIDSEGSFSYRVQTGDSAWLGGQNPSVRRNYAQALATSPEPVTLTDLLRADSALARSNAARVENRFFTPLVDIKEANNVYDTHFENVTRRGYQIPRSATPPGYHATRSMQDPFGFYLNSSQNAEVMGRGMSFYNRPISMLIDPEQYRYRMPNGPWDAKPALTEEEFLLRGVPGDTMVNTRRNAGWDAASFEAVTSGDNAQELARKYGIRLGNSVSSNPEQEIFVPKTMANRARRVGNVVNISTNNPVYGDISPIEVWGPPRVNPKVQVLNNAARITGNALGAVGMIPDIGRLAFGGGDIAIGPDGMPYVASSQEMNARNMTPREGTPAEAMWTPETDEENKQRMAQLEMSDKQAKEERELRKKAREVMMKTVSVENNIRSSPFWTTIK